MTNKRYAKKYYKGGNFLAPVQYYKIKIYSIADEVRVYRKFGGCSMASASHKNIYKNQ